MHAGLYVLLFTEARDFDRTGNRYSQLDKSLRVDGRHITPSWMFANTTDCLDGPRAKLVLNVLYFAKST